MEHAEEMLKRHLSLSPNKPVSYLPIQTIESVIGLTISAYTKLIARAGNSFAIFGPDDCCIKSGAIYAYSQRDLERLLNVNLAILREQGWAVDSASFIHSIAVQWLPDDHPLMPVVRQAFGDTVS